MTRLTTPIIVTEDGCLSLAEPLPPGEYIATIEVAADVPQRLGHRATKPFDVNALLGFALGPWPAGTTFSRDEIYGDDGR